MPALPCSPYAATKVASESLMRAFCASFGIDTISLRYFNVFGPRQNANSAYAAVIAAFARALLAGHRPIIHGDGQQTRDFTFVANIVHANLLAARHPGRLGGEILNVGCGGQISINQLASLMAQSMNRPDLVPIHHPDRPGDLKHSCAALERTHQLLDYQPIVDFVHGLEKTIQWYVQSTQAIDVSGNRQESQNPIAGALVFEPSLDDPSAFSPAQSV